MSWKSFPLPAMQRLATGEWFTSRISACGLFAGAYARTTGSQRADLRQLYGLLCRDETPMVRSQLLLNPSCTAPGRGRLRTAAATRRDLSSDMRLCPSLLSGI